MVPLGVRTCRRLDEWALPLNKAPEKQATFALNFDLSSSALLCTSPGY